MNLIHINRKIFNALIGEEREIYVRDIVSREVEEYNSIAKDETIDADDISRITKGIIRLIVSNENIIRKYGWEKYVESNYPAYADCQGYSYSSGKFGVMAFDWSAETVDELDYSFSIFKIL